MSEGSDAFRVYIGLGSNLGRREENVRRALARIEEKQIASIVTVSSLRETAPWGVTDQPAFINAAALIETRLAPRELLAALKTIEQEMGRTPTRRWGERVIDLDILFCVRQGAHVIVNDDDLVIPHPLAHERTCILEPLIEIDPGLVHPAMNATVGALLARLRRPEKESPS